MHLEPDLVVAVRLDAVFGEECGLGAKSGQYLRNLRTDDCPAGRSLKERTATLGPGKEGRKKVE